MKTFILLFLAIILETIGTSSLKASEQFTKITPCIITILSYLGSFYLFGLSLKKIPIGIAYSIWAGVGIVLITIVGYFKFKQSLDFASILGIIFILLGVLVINLFSKSIH